MHEREEHWRIRAKAPSAEFSGKHWRIEGQIWLTNVFGQEPLTIGDVHIS
jgi:hypothetical protein